MKVVLLSSDLQDDRLERAEAHLQGKAETRRVHADGTLEGALRGADAYLCVGFAHEFPEDPAAYERLAFVQATLAGVDHLPYERIPTKVTICGNAGAYNTSLAEHAFALLLAAAKHVVLHATSIRKQAFEQGLPGKQLRGATLGIVGLGGIGKEVGRLGKAFGMRVVGITGSGRSDFPADFIGGPGDLARILEESDFVLIAVPHTKDTHHLIAAKELGRMRHDAVIVNVARGDVIREEDLFQHLRNVPTFHAASDVWWRYPKGAGYPYSFPFHTLPNFFGTPHVGWNVPPQRMAALDSAAGNLKTWLEDGSPRNTVDRMLYEKVVGGK